MNCCLGPRFLTILTLIFTLSVLVLAIFIFHAISLSMYDNESSSNKKIQNNNSLPDFNSTMRPILTITAVTSENFDSQSSNYATLLPAKSDASAAKTSVLSKLNLLEAFNLTKIIEEKIIEFSKTRQFFENQQSSQLDAELQNSEFSPEEGEKSKNQSTTIYVTKKSVNQTQIFDQNLTESVTLIPDPRRLVLEDDQELVINSTQQTILNAGVTIYDNDIITLNPTPIGLILSQNELNSSQEDDNQNIENSSESNYYYVYPIDYET